MTFIALDIQRNYMMQQQSALQFKEICIQDNKQYAQTQMANEQSKASKAGTTLDTTTGAYAVYYSQDQLFTQQIASIETQLKALQSAIESFGKVEDNNIKNGCKLNIGG